MRTRGLIPGEGPGRGAPRGGGELGPRRRRRRPAPPAPPPAPSTSPGATRRPRPGRARPRGSRRPRSSPSACRRRAPCRGRRSARRRGRAARRRRRRGRSPGSRRRRRSGGRSGPGPPASAASARSGATSIRGLPTIQSSAPLSRRERLEQVLDPLVGAQQPEEEDHRPLGPLQLGRQRLLVRQPGQVVEGAVGDDPHPAGSSADLVAQPRGAVLGVGDDRVHRAEDAPRGGDLAAARAGRAGCSGRSSPAAGVGGSRRTSRAGSGRATGSGRRRRRRGAAQPQHVGDVLGRLEGDAPAGVEAAGGAAAVEALPHLVALGAAAPGRRGSALVSSSTSAPAARERRREGAVVGRREGRGIDELDFMVRIGSRGNGTPAIIVPCLAPTLSYCVVNTNGREHLLACLRGDRGDPPATGLEREILVLDNASTDGSADAVRALGGDVELIELRAATAARPRTTRPC